MMLVNWSSNVNIEKVTVQNTKNKETTLKSPEQKPR